MNEDQGKVLMNEEICAIFSNYLVIGWAKSTIC